MLSTTKARWRRCYIFLTLVTLLSFITSGVHVITSGAYFRPSTSIRTEELVAIRNKQECRGPCVGKFVDPYNLTVPPFLKDVKNPCWRESLVEAATKYRTGCNQKYAGEIELAAWTEAERDVAAGKTSRLRCLPYAYLIGMPKCGTTDLFFRLIEHSDVLPGLRKESHWPAKGAFGAFIKEPEHCVPFSRFLDNFDVSARQIEKRPLTSITIDSSASTMWFQNGDNYRKRTKKEPPLPATAQLLRRITPDAKFIVILRNPVDRLYSDFFYFKPTEDLTPTSFHGDIIESVSRYSECFRNNTASKCVYDSKLRNKSVERVRIGFYDTYLADWWSVFPRESFHVLIMERYAQDQAAHMDKVFTFLGLDPLWKRRSNFHAVDVKYNSKDNVTGKQEMLPKTKKILYDFYRPSVENLAKILNDSSLLELWNFK